MFPMANSANLAFQSGFLIACMLFDIDPPRAARLDKTGGHYPSPNSTWSEWLLIFFSCSDHRLDIWPGYCITVDEQEGGLMLCLDASHRVLRQETILMICIQTKH
ncbi:Piwi-like protein 1 [Folsomia candida]|uniref:Piwi-like protein 1 n=1 Tax=Folsomia candida TaxID=158441 RepID=A0A226DE08_FOLCA|nr:Piwi-like protein 1 [Folsomia candida]